MLYYNPRLPKKAQQGQRFAQTALNVDIAPTLLDVAGVPAPEAMQRESLLPLICGESVEDWRQDFCYEHVFDVQSLYDQGRIDPDRLWLIPQSEGIVSAAFKYLYYYNQPSPNEVLYDLRRAPRETTNVINDKDYETTGDSLRQRMKVLRTKAE